MVKLERLGVILKPTEDIYGKFARFNPGAVLKNDIVHLLYRATNTSFYERDKYISTIGYAQCDLSGNILFDTNKPVIFPTLPDEAMGCEDPRIVLFEGVYYIFYTAYDGIMPRVAIASTLDFKSFKKFGVIHHSEADKDAFILPERINGKIAYVHRIEPSIQIDYFDSIQSLVNPKNWENYESIRSASTVMSPQFEWESSKIGGSVPPIKTQYGWLFFYHGVDNHHIYRAGAALLDINDPSKVIGRLRYPILEPEEQYELFGDVNNVVFPEGAYQSGGDIFVVYGAADKYIALAKIRVDLLLNALLNSNK